MCEILIRIHTHDNLLYEVTQYSCPFSQMQIPERKLIQLNADSEIKPYTCAVSHKLLTQVEGQNGKETMDSYHSD